MTFGENREPPRQIWYGLEEALVLLAALEDARDALIAAGQLAEAVPVEDQIRLLSRRLATIPKGKPMSADPLRASEAARRLGIPTKELLRLIYERQIRYVMVDGIAHIPADALDEYRGRAS